MNSKWVIVFDWDGTLIDSLPYKIQNASLLFAQRFGVEEERVRNAYRLHSGIPRRQLFDAICADLSLPPLTDDTFSQLSKKFSDVNRQVISKLKVPDDTINTLTALKEKQYSLFISTAAAQEEVSYLARKLGVSFYFTEVLGSKDGFTKGPVHIAYLREKYGYPDEKFIFVGDEPNDVLLGKQAGILTAVRLGSHDEKTLKSAAPDFIIHTLFELIDILN